MVGVVKQVDAAATVAQMDAMKLAGTLTSEVQSAAGIGAAVAQKDQKAAQGWLRRNVWGVLGVVVILAVILWWVLVR